MTDIVSIPLPGTEGTLSLHARGDLDLNAPRVAIIGSRSCTEYGEHVAADLATGLVERGYVIVSGGAFGIDGAAHRGALAADGTTWAVLACGADMAYPRAHARMFDRIATGGKGALLSQYEDGMAPTHSRFLARNRVIAQLATSGVIVVEAGMRSGSLSTASHARKLGRPLYAVPGPITSSQSEGCHWLIRHGATLLTDAGDIALGVDTNRAGLF